MTATQDGVVRYTCTRIQLIDALAALPLGGYLNLEARGRFADILLAQLPEAPADTSYCVPAGREGTFHRMAGLDREVP